ncbi:MAG: PilZ domain-containing protein [Acidobacteriota bacterium]|nr:PilZ domain-containing protein [Acidobacteriota bacterium]
MSAIETSGPPEMEDSRLADVHRALLNLHLLLRCERLYDKKHPRRLAALEKAFDSLHGAAQRGKFDVYVRRDGLAVSPSGAAYLQDARGEMLALASALMQAGIKQISFTKNLGLAELNVFVELIKVSLITPGQTHASIRGGEARGSRDEWWTTQLSVPAVKGILVNSQVDRKVDTLLTSLIAALVAYGGNSARANADELIRLPEFDDLAATLTLLARITLPLENSRALSPEEGAGAIHAAMEEARHDTVRLLLSAISQYDPEEGELPQPYIARLSENLIFEYLVAEFAAGSITPLTVRPTVDRLGALLAAAGKYSSSHSPDNYSSLARAWATEEYREKLVTRFWLELPPREKSLVLRGPDLWAVPVVALRQTLKNLADAGADAPRREARHILLNYARRLEHEDWRARRLVAAGLLELCSVIESLWPNQFPEDLSRGALQALEAEVKPQAGALLASFLEWLGRIAVTRADYAGFEAILLALENAPQGNNHAHLSALVKRMVSPERWMLLVDAALANRPLDPVLPRLLVRDPDKLLDRMTLLLCEPRGTEMLAAMSRLLRTIGQPVLSVLETRLYEARPQRVTAAIKLLASADPDRLLRGLTRALSSWEWNMQDLAVSELSRPANASAAQTAAFIFSSVLATAHPLVVPMMIDQIGLAGERTAIPQLMEIASGAHPILREQFVRIKAIEGLGRLRAMEAMELLHSLAERRAGIAFAEPSGLRAAAQDALAMIEDRPVSASVRATFDAPTPNTALYAAPRRYMRVPLAAPLRAQVGGPSGGAQVSLARVKTISLGGAYLESSQKFAVGDSLQLEVRSGLRKIHCTAVVRNAAPGGGGVEFVHMKDNDRDKLRKLVLRNLHSR